MNDYNTIINTNTEVLSNIVSIILEKNSISLEQLNNSSNNVLKTYISGLLNSVKNKDLQLVILKWDIESHNELLQMYRNAYVGGELNPDAIGAGFNNGLKPNTVEERQIKLLEMREEQLARIEKYAEIEKRFESETKLICEFINLLPQDQYSTVLYATYFKNKTQSVIADELKIADDTVRTNRFRGIDCLTLIVRAFLRKE